MPAATVAVIEGSAFGGGAELSTACDFRVMQEQARIRFVHTVMGVSPGASAQLQCLVAVQRRSQGALWSCMAAGWGGGTRLTRLVGRRTALQLLGGAQAQTARDAVSCGLADHVVSGDCDADFGSRATSHTDIQPYSAPHDSATLTAALQWVAPLLRGPAASVKGIKTVIAAADALPAVPALEVEAQVFASLWGGPAAKAALARTKHGSKSESSGDDS